MTTRTCAAAKAVAGHFWSADGEINEGVAVHTCGDPVWCAGVGRLTNRPGARFRLGTEWRPGSPIAWTHFYPTGEVVERTGVIWELAPLFSGAVQSVWVIPDHRAPGDQYSVIAVGKSSRRHNVHGGRVVPAYAWVEKGQAFSSNLSSSPSGRLAAIAATRATAQSSWQEH